MTLPLTDDELQKIEDRLSKLAPVPWKSYVGGRDFAEKSPFKSVKKTLESNGTIKLVGLSSEDRAFIISARQDIPRLLAEIRTLRSVVKAFRSVM